jgi:hypothetical protein
LSSESRSNTGGGDAAKSGKHTAIIQDTDIVEGRLNSSEHIANCGSVLSIDITLPMYFTEGGDAGDGTAPPRSKGGVSTPDCITPTIRLRKK